MNTIQIKVECYSGYKADEYPKCFYWKDEKFEIKEISDRWYQGDRDPEHPVADYFKVNTIHDRQYIIKHEVEKDRWYLIVAHPDPAHPDYNLAQRSHCLSRFIGKRSE